VLFFLCSGCGAHLARLSFPTRRSSDLSGRESGQGERRGGRLGVVVSCPGGRAATPAGAVSRCGSVVRRVRRAVQPEPLPGQASRSEEHTSELQSRENLVCRLLLEKKNT